MRARRRDRRDHPPGARADAVPAAHSPDEPVRDVRCARVAVRIARADRARRGPVARRRRLRIDDPPFPPRLDP